MPISSAEPKSAADLGKALADVVERALVDEQHRPAAQRAVAPHLARSVVKQWAATPRACATAPLRDKVCMHGSRAPLHRAC